MIVEEEVRAFNLAFERALFAQDAEVLVALYREDARILVPGQPAIQGSGRRGKSVVVHRRGAASRQAPGRPAGRDDVPAEEVLAERARRIPLT